MTKNPLLTISDLPNMAPPFAQIKDEHYLPAVKSAIEEARENYEAIKNNPDAPNFENTLEAMETASETLGTVTGIFYNQLSAVGGDELHALAEKIGPITSNFGSDIILDETLFERVKTIFDQKATLDLDTESMTLLKDSYKSFVRGGALLNDEDKKTLRELNEELSTLGPSFMNNCSKSAEAFELIIDNEDDLSGLPESAIAGAKSAAKEKDLPDGQYRFTLDYPSYIPFVQYADNRELRETMWRAFANRAWGDDYDNSKNIKRIVTLKDKRAKLLGYKNHASFVLEERMAKSPETVLGFLEKMKNAYKPAAEKELKELQAFAKEEGLKSDLQPWDVGYYSEKLKQKLFEFSSEDLRPYFPLEPVLGGCFEHFSKLFGLQFKENKTYEVWHKDVKAFDLTDQNGDFVGTLYADFFPRTGKKQGAWKTAYRNQGLFNGKIERPVIAIVCNFTKPTEDKPSLLTHGEVTTLFHEMGHAIHALLSDVKYSSHAGTSVLWDFVELPSQVQENWCYEKETLDMFASHYETGEKIPSDLIKKLQDAKNFMGGWGGLRQTNFGYLDMAWHTCDPNKIDDVGKFEDEATKGLSLFPRLAGPMSSSFAHIFAGGYSAGYYSYKWAEVLDADTFEAFLENGLYDQKTANAYKDEILSRGGSEDPEILYRNFRGRDADPDALLRREGMIDKAA